MEGIAAYVALLDERRCDGCRECLPVCPSRALVWIPGDDEIMLDPWTCTGCGTCTTHCPTAALSLGPRAHR